MTESEKTKPAFHFTFYGSHEALQNCLFIFLFFLPPEDADREWICDIINSKHLQCTSRPSTFRFIHLRSHCNSDKLHDYQ